MWKLYFYLFYRSVYVSYLTFYFEVWKRKCSSGSNIVWCNVPQWIKPAPNVDLQLTEQKREWTENNVDNIGYLVQDYVKRKCFHYLSIFTDETKDPGVYSRNNYR